MSGGVDIDSCEVLKCDSAFEGLEHCTIFCATCGSDGEDGVTVDCPECGGGGEYAHLDSEEYEAKLGETDNLLLGLKQSLLSQLERFDVTQVNIMLPWASADQLAKVDVKQLQTGSPEGSVGMPFIIGAAFYHIDQMDAAARGSPAVAAPAPAAVAHLEPVSSNGRVADQAAHGHVSPRTEAADQPLGLRRRPVTTTAASHVASGMTASGSAQPAVSRAEVSKQHWRASVKDVWALYTDRKSPQEAQRYNAYVTEQVVALILATCKIVGVMYWMGGFAAVSAGVLQDAGLHISFGLFNYFVAPRVAKHYPQHLGPMWLAANLYFAAYVYALGVGWLQCHCMCVAIRQLGRPFIPITMQLVLWGPYQQVNLLGTLVTRAAISAAFWAMFYTEGVVHAWAWALFLYLVSVVSALVVDVRRRKAFLSARLLTDKVPESPTAGIRSSM